MTWSVRFSSLRTSPEPFRRMALALALWGLVAIPSFSQTPGSVFVSPKPAGGGAMEERTGPPTPAFVPPKSAGGGTTENRAGQPAPVPTPPKTAGVRTGCDRDTSRIALDIGHDRTKPGATSARGISEFFYNQALGRDVLRALQAEGFRGAFLIGESGAPMPLLRRTQIAREQGAALFVSLHHDSAQKQYFSQWTVDGRSLPYSDNFHGYSIFVSATTPRARESLALATALGRALKAHGLTPSLHHAEPIPGENRTLLDRDLGIYRFDELAVLRTATMPALLLESGVIVNRDEEQAIRSGQLHPRIAAALVEALSRLCAAAPARP